MEITIYIAHNQYSMARATFTSPTGRKIYVNREKMDKELKIFKGVIGYKKVSYPQMEMILLNKDAIGWEDSPLIKEELGKQNPGLVTKLK